jgi:hypothetical protein
MTRAIRILNSSQNITAVVTAVAPPPEDVEEERELHANLFLAAFGIVFSCLAILWLKLCTGPRIFPSSPSSFDTSKIQRENPFELFAWHSSYH